MLLGSWVKAVPRLEAFRLENVEGSLDLESRDKGVRRVCQYAKDSLFWDVQKDGYKVVGRADDDRQPSLQRSKAEWWSRP